MTARRTRTSAALVSAVAIAAWLLLPALTPVHVEGFSAQIASIALYAQGEGVEAHDPFLPLITEFIYLTRAGVVHILATMYETTGIIGDWAFSILTLVSLATILIASVVFARKWNSCPPVAAIAAMLLTPGIPETGFFFNDNIVSAAFSSVALAVIGPGAKPPSHVLAGALLAIATVCRLDAVLIAPALLLLAMSAQAPTPERAMRVLALATGGIITLTLIESFTEYSIWASFQIAREFKAIVEGWYSLGDAALTFLYFWGPIMLFVCPIGGFVIGREALREKKWTLAAGLIGYPLLLVLYALTTSREVRYIYPLLAPIVATIGGRGLQQIMAAATGYRKPEKAVALVIMILGAVSFVAPPTLLWVSSVSDGPRMFLGRLWSPFLWERWQRAVGTSMRRIAQLVDQIGHRDSAVVISTHHNDVFYLRLRLFEAGFKPALPATLPISCRDVSTYRRGTQVVFHVRAEPQYTLGGFSYDEATALQISQAFKCDEVTASAAVFLTIFGGDAGRLDQAIYPISIAQFPGPHEVGFGADLWRSLKPIPGIPAQTYGLFDFVRLTSSQVTAIRSMTEDYIRGSRRVAESGGGQESFGKFHSSFAPRYLRPDSVGLPKMPDLDLRKGADPKSPH